MRDGIGKPFHLRWLFHTEKIMETKKLNALIKKIAGNAKSLREDIQTALIGCAIIAQRDRNTTPFNQLFEAVGEGTRKEGMLKWSAIYAPIHFKNGEVKLSDKRQKEYDGTIEQFAADLENAPKWYEMAKPEPIANPWDSAKFATALADYLVKAAEKAEKNGDETLGRIARDAELLFRVRLNEAYDVEVVSS